MGNKWRKLKYNIEYFKEKNFKNILTFGGAHSNHILATAAAGNIFNIPTIGIIRGEELSITSNETLAKADSLGMKLVFIPRNEYKHRNHVDFIKNLSDNYEKTYIIPEGGCNELAIKGSSEIFSDSKINFDFYACSCGTGTTAAGIASKMPIDSKLLIFPSLNQTTEQGVLVSKINPTKHIIWNKNYIFGGYAKVNKLLEEFISDFPIPLDNVYTGKLFWGVFKLIEEKYFPQNSKIVIYHSGGYRI